MSFSNPSNEIGFVQQFKDNVGANEAFESKDTLAFETETTGLLMQMEGLDVKNLQTKKEKSLREKLTVGKVPEAGFESIIRTDVEEELVTRVSKRNAGITTMKQPKTEAAPVTVEEPTFEAIIGEQNNILPIWFLECGFNRSRAICHISTTGIDYKGRNTSWLGTGFMVSENIMLTNYHVLNSKSVCENAIISFNFQMNEFGKIQPSQTFQLNPKRLFISSPENELDFAFVWVDGAPGREFGFIKLLRHAFVVKEKDFANIIQHPGGKVKAIALQNNQISAQNEKVVHYTTDTLAGSSGAVVMNNQWKAFALHHATREEKKADVAKNIPAVLVNEGIKFSAIATYLESIADPRSSSQINEALALFQDTDAMLGYFGGLGREGSLKNETGLERVVEVYKGEAKDVDIAFWNIEWFNKHYREKIEEVAKVIVRMNLDVWAFEETSPTATEALVRYLKDQYAVDYDCLASEPDAPDGKQTTTIMWNTKTVNIERREWPDKVKGWLELNSTGIKNPGDMDLEASVRFENVDGKIFDRYPGLFFLTTKNRNGNTFTANIVPLHLKAMGEGSKRRILASRILSVAVQHCIEKEGFDSDWILGGDFNATLASEDFNYLLNGKLTAVSAADAEAGEMSYIKGRFKSLIDHIFISPNLQDVSDSEFIIVAKDKVLPDYLSISDHRPVLIRLSLADELPEGPSGPAPDRTDDVLTDAMERLSKRKKTNKSTGRKPATAMRRSTPSADRESNLAELASNRSRPYYDSDADKEAVKEYYGQLPTNADGKTFYKFLNNLLTSTHTQELGYQPSRYVYPWVDLQEDKQTIRNIYSGSDTTPEALIEADFKVESAVFENLLASATDGFESLSEGGQETIFEALENSQGYNCEHVVPQSWFGKANPMKGDLHHLFSCTPNCNSFRNNIPYYEFPDWEEKIMQDCGNREDNRFEPKEGKGIVARAVLYFLVRYPKTIAQYTREDIQTLLEWHVNEPPGIYEKHRNVAIQELQGNRNPFIDYPKLAAKVDFAQGLSGR